MLSAHTCDTPLPPAPHAPTASLPPLFHSQAICSALIHLHPDTLATPPPLFHTHCICCPHPLPWGLAAHALPALHPQLPCASTPTLPRFILLLTSWFGTPVLHRHTPCSSTLAPSSVCQVSSVCHVPFFHSHFPHSLLNSHSLHLPTHSLPSCIPAFLPSTPPYFLYAPGPAKVGVLYCKTE